MKPKQCGNCEFWDREKRMEVSPDKRICAPCVAPTPMWISISGEHTWEDVGQDCPVYVERQDVIEEDDDQPDDNGYTRADEDWFFDDK